MKDFKLYKRLTAIALAGTMTATAFGLVGCSKKEENKTSEDTAIVTIQNSVDQTEKGLVELFPTMSKDIVKNAAIIIRLEEISKKDENGKISSDIISKLKSKVDVDNMINDFNAFTDELEETMIQNNKTVYMDDYVIHKDQRIIYAITQITNSIITGDEATKKTNFDLIYKLFVEEDEITYDGLTFSIRELSYAGRAIAQVYARTCANKAKEVITEEEYSKIDARTNDQNNKAYIKTELEILANGVNEKSEIDVVSSFNKKYDYVKKVLDGKVKTDDETIKNLVNYTNLEYLTSDKVSTKDKNTILGSYEEKDVTDVLILIDAITKYNEKNTSSMIPLSILLVDEYAKTESGKTDKTTLNFVQFNSTKFLTKTEENTNSKDLFKKGSFQSIYKYMCEGDFPYKQGDKSVDVIYHNISDGTKFIANAVVYYTLTQRPNIFSYTGYKEKINKNLEKSIQRIQNATTGECEKVEIVEFIKK